MRTGVVRIVLSCLTVLLCILPGCGGSGGSDGSSPAPVAQPGSLNVSIAGLPAGASAAVTVTGTGFSQAVSVTGTVANLTAGSFTVAAAGVTSGGVLYVALNASQTVTVAAGATATVTVTYSVARLALQEVFPASGLVAPVLLTAPVNDARVFIVERPGRIRIVRNGALLPTPFLDITARTTTLGEGGLLSVAFSPGYATNGTFFIYFTDVDGNIAVELFHASANPDVADPTPLRILSIAHPVNTNHYGGLLVFGLDGFLYMGTGDGGGGGDPTGNAQNLNVLLGKLLRLDVSAASAAQPYVVPAGNPFVGQAGRRGEIWAYGLRNPWRYGFDAPTGMLYIADVGQARQEEVDVAVSTAPGLNYGWNITEGTLCYPTDPCSTAGITMPVLVYGHDASGGCSIIGGAVYRGSVIPEVAGRYFYSDYCSGWLRSFALVGGVATEQTDWNIANVGQIVSFGADAQNELYMLSATGRIYRIVRG